MKHGHMEIHWTRHGHQRININKNLKKCIIQCNYKCRCQIRHVSDIETRLIKEYSCFISQVYNTQCRTSFWCNIIHTYQIYTLHSPLPSFWKTCLLRTKYHTINYVLFQFSSGSPVVENVIFSISIVNWRSNGWN